MNKDLSWISTRPIAHRGLHDGNKLVWENTLSAFARAKDRNFGIECDLQYANDGKPVVFHDDDMERLCNMKVDVRSKTSGELGLMSIGGTADKVPSLKKLLNLVQGAVPLVLELKGREGDDEGFADAVLETLQDYDGPIALMSFDHWLLRDLKRLDCPCPVGLTAEGTKPEEFENHEKAMARGLDFISYDINHLPNDFVSKYRNSGMPILTWTVRNKQQALHSSQFADQMTFEGFDP